jgi:glyoxylase-like metal-dependent hydrolase (beta-lactamase superfamily II)
MHRREFLKDAMAGGLALAASRRMAAQQPAGNLRRLTDQLAIVDDGGTNVVAFSSDGALVLVDSGAPNSGGHVMAALKSWNANAKIQTLFNTHYHLEQTGNNQMFAAAGAKIIAHDRTRQWMSTDYWVPELDRYEKARPKEARPTQTFETAGSLTAGDEKIDYGYLLLAHTSGDIYVFFRKANVLAVGDVASPVRDPALDYFTGAWIGGRVDAMDKILTLASEQTRIVPAYGPVMTRAEFKAERDMMEEVRSRLWTKVREGDGPQDMLQGGLLKNLPRTWKDPYKFLYDAAKGLWAHHDKLDRNVV